MMTRADRKTIFAWRATSFGRIRKVPPYEAQRWPGHRRALIRTPRRRDWTHDELDRLYDLLDAGYGYTEIAQLLKRSRTAITVKTNRLNCRMTRRACVLTAREVARLLGKGCAKAVVCWIHAGWLTAKAAPHNGRHIWRVVYDDLLVFLRNPDYWMAWNPARITDADLRAAMTALRAGQPQWLTPGQVAQRYHVTTSAVSQWIRHGAIPATRYGNWWINERDLIGWRIPSDVPQREWRARAAPREKAPETRQEPFSGTKQTQVDSETVDTADKA